ncbi:MAG TPA: hypothetical protein VF950_21770 [Planctomycetota bacterium]
MRFKVVFQAALVVGASLSVIGGAAIAILHVLDPQADILLRLVGAYHHLVFGFGFLTLFALTSAAIDFLGARKPSEAAPPRPVAIEVAPVVAKPPAPAPKRSKLDALYHEMRTYVDLEMWELALEKATSVVNDFPGTREADLVSKNLGELRWKAEPKFVSMKEPMSADQEKELREKGLKAMVQHVKTYVDLEMWELARQKAQAIMKSFPDSAEAAEMLKLYAEVDRKARETAGAPAASNT